jgi:hypothetical protein
LAVWAIGFNRNDEPPDTGIFAKLPKPKSPHFPRNRRVNPKSAPSQPKSAQVSPSQPKSIRHLETIPKLFIASPLAAALSQPDRRQEVMLKLFIGTQQLT